MSWVFGSGPLPGGFPRVGRLGKLPESRRSFIPLGKSPHIRCRFLSVCRAWDKKESEPRLFLHDRKRVAKFYVQLAQQNISSSAPTGASSRWFRLSLIYGFWLQNRGAVSVLETWQLEQLVCSGGCSIPVPKCDNCIVATE